MPGNLFKSFKFQPYRQIAFDGLWYRNQALVALLGLCPLLAVSHSVINSLGLGLATTFALTASNLIISLLRHHIQTEIRLPAFVLLIATQVTVIDLLMNAFFYDLHRVLGIFIPLIVTNCVIMGRAEAFASKNSADKAFMDGLFTGLGFTLALVFLGALREIIGKGTLLSGADLMFGDFAKHWTIRLFDDYEGFLLAILPPGAFIGLGLLIALKNFYDARNL